MTKKHWKVLGSNTSYAFQPPEWGLTMVEERKMTWAHKSRLQKVANAKKDYFYFNIAKCRATAARDLYSSLYQKYLGMTPKFLNCYFSYMVARYEDSIVKGIPI